MIIYRAAALLPLMFCVHAAGQTTFWNGTATPGTAQVTNDTSSVTLGLKFSSTVPGVVTGVRFYKGTRNTGTHIGRLWSSTGAKLAEVTFSNETAYGWQQANFPAPVNIAANTTYVISYLAPRGYYAADTYYPWSSLNSSTLRVSGSSPGVYAYGSTTSFPTGTWNRCNYWVDVVFVPQTSGTPTYSISGTITGSPATVTLSGTKGGTAATDSSGKYTFTNLSNGLYVVAPSRSGYSFSPSTATVTINGASVSAVNFTATPIPSPSHSVTLSWNPSTSPNISGYHVYRGSASGGPYAKLTSSPLSGTSFIDNAVAAGQTYYYVTTAVDSTSESSYSNQAAAVVPTP
jgi:hypothetical protein